MNIITRRDVIFRNLSDDSYNNILLYDIDWKVIGMKWKEFFFFFRMIDYVIVKLLLIMKSRRYKYILTNCVNSDILNHRIIVNVIWFNGLLYNFDDA